MKKILKFIKKIIWTAFLIYGYNIIAQPLNLIIPINIWTVLLITILGPVSLISLVLVKLIIF